MGCIGMKRTITCIKLFGCVIWAYLSLSANAMTLVTQGNTLYATGEVTDDYRQFTEAFENKEIERVVFVNSPGGDLWTGMRIGRLIADKGLNTVTAGSCASACAIMFMGGRVRSFSDAYRPTFTYVGIHGPANKYTKEVNREQAGQIYAFFQHQMGERFNATFVNEALFDMDDAGALTKVFDAARTPKLFTYHCKSAQTLRKDCVDYKIDDAYSLGVITSVELTHVDLPATFKNSPRILGLELNAGLDDAGNVLKALSSQQCTSDNCKKALENYSNQRDNKALAIPLHEGGYGLANNIDSAAKAYFSALYSCNHIKDRPPRLCEVQVVNTFDVRDQLYVQGDISHAQALQRLQSPAFKFYGDEEYGGFFTSAKKLKTQKFHDMTPQNIEGIQTVDTQSLANWLKKDERPVVVDVWAGADDAIPSAVTLYAGGLAFEDAAADAAYNARFQGLLKLFAPDLDKPVVFYCMSRDCWLSVNAAMRARDIGYTQVNWYRGGLQSWKAAGLATARVVVRAVVH